MRFGLSLSRYCTRAGRGEVRTRVRLFGLWTPIVRVRAEPEAWGMRCLDFMPIRSQKPPQVPPA